MELTYNHGDNIPTRFLMLQSDTPSARRPKEACKPFKHYSILPELMVTFLSMLIIHFLPEITFTYVIEH